MSAKISVGTKMVYVGSSDWNKKVYAIVKNITPKGFLKIATITKENQDESTVEASDRMFEKDTYFNEDIWTAKGYSSDRVKVATKEDVESVKALWKAEDEKAAAKKSIENAWAYKFKSGQVNLETILEYIGNHDNTVSVNTDYFPVMTPKSFAMIQSQMVKLGFGSVFVACAKVSIHGSTFQVQTYVDGGNVPSVLMNHICGVRGDVPHFHIVNIGTEAYLIEGNSKNDDEIRHARVW